VDLALYWCYFSVPTACSKISLIHSSRKEEKRSVLRFSPYYTYCYRFAWQGFGSGGPIGVASVSSCEKLPPCLIKPVPDGSKMDPPLPKAKPISNGGSTDNIFKKG